MSRGVWFCRRSDFLKAKGFDESRHMGEDVAFLSRLKRLGASRCPKQRLATRFTAKRFGVSPALVINSSRKWDRRGDWHMIADVFRGPYYFLFARHRIKEYAPSFQHAKDMMIIEASQAK
jgi:hypothetical protein